MDPAHQYHLIHDPNFQEPQAMKKLMSLDQWNTEASRLHSLRYPRLNNIACPKCGAELQDVDGLRTLSNPPKVEVECSVCDFTGYRVANT